MNRMTTRIVLAATVGLALLTTACTGETGKAQPGSTTETTSPTSTSTSTAADSELAGLKPCDLLTESESTSLGLRSPGTAKKVASAETCRWILAGSAGLTAGIRPTQGVKDLDAGGGKTSQTKVGTFDATKIEAPDGAENLCEVVISVSESSSVQVLWGVDATSKDTAAACAEATKAAGLIAPKLS